MLPASLGMVIGLSGPVLPLVGPFASNAPVPIAGLSNYIVNTGVSLSNTQNRATPIKAATFEIDNNFSTTHGSIQPDYSTTSSIFIWADNVVWNATCAPCNPEIVTLRGQDGTGYTGCCGGLSAPPNGGAGGGGGGGGGKVQSPCGCGTIEEGGNGGSGGNGDDGNIDGGCCGPGAGGLGFGAVDASGFAYPNGGGGGYGGIDTCGGTSGGSGGPGYSGGGGGGQANFDGCGGGGSVAGAGGGGGGLLTIACNSLTGENFISLDGGSGGNTQNLLVSGGGGGGGGGAAWVAAKHYDGQTTISVSGGSGGNTCGCGGNGSPGTDGNAVIYEINHDGTLGAQKSFGDTWDNR